MHNTRSSLFGSVIENVFENTISNILTEAFNKEFSLTSRPRLIALPPKLTNGYTQSSSLEMKNSLEMNSSNFQKNKSDKSKTDGTIEKVVPNESHSHSPTLSIKSIEVN